LGGRKSVEPNQSQNKTGRKSSSPPEKRKKMRGEMEVNGKVIDDEDQWRHLTGVG